MYNFLIEPFDKELPPILLINYDRFAPDDIVRLNTVIDEKRFIDGIPIPDPFLVLGLINLSKVSRYKESDFYSRFDAVEQNTISAADLEKHINTILPLSILKVTTEKNLATINLYNSNLWEAMLLGEWIIKGKLLYFKKGKLKKALESGLPLELQNAPWSNPKFLLFWQEASLLGYVKGPGGLIKLSTPLKLYHSKGYDWDYLSTAINWQYGLKKEAIVLNPTLYLDFFRTYFINNQSLHTVPGHLKSHANKQLAINLTRPLTEDAAAMLLASAKKYNVQLDIYAVANCPKPSFITTTLVDKIRIEPSFERSTSLVTPDFDLAIALHCSKEGGYPSKNYLILDISELYINDLLRNIKGRFEAGKIKFQEKQGILLKALKANQPVILKGQWTDELIDALAPLLLGDSAALITIITENPIPFSFLKQQKIDSTLANKQKYLNPLIPLSDALIEKETLAKLKARQLYLALNPKSQDSTLAWQGLYNLPLPPKLEAHFDPLQSKEEALAFNRNRLNQILNILSNAPYVYLTGLTGVGKTTFVEKYLRAKYCEATLFQGESRIKAWALAKEPQLKILFIDEANVNASQWSLFEGLFNNPPGIPYQGKYYILSKDHKVIFAGNPLSYGNRKLSPLFRSHGLALTFEPLSLAFIFEKIIKPIFKGSLLEKESSAIAKPLFAVYKYLVAASTTSLLISPRELQMMALLVLGHFKNAPTFQEKAKHVASFYAYNLGKCLLAENPHAFKKAHKPCKMAWDKFIPFQNINNFIITPSRQRIYHYLTDFLQLAKLRRESTQIKEKAILYGGLGGLIIEGEPGIGKTELVYALLNQMGFKELAITDEPTEGLIFYTLPHSLQPEEKEAFLIKAFHAGAVVVINELNAAPLREGLLNDLLMGRTPTGKRPKKPGFMIIGTQNPPSMEGRSVLSEAQARRFLLVRLPAYKEAESLAILKAKGLPEKKALALIP